MDFLMPHDTDNLCFLVAKPPLNPKWMDMFNPFRLDVWITVFSSLGICCFLVFLYGHYYPTSEFTGDKGIEMVIAVFFDESHPMSKKLRYAHESLLDIEEKLLPWLFAGHMESESSWHYSCLCFTHVPSRIVVV